MTQINLPRQKSGEQAHPALNETMPLLPLSGASGVSLSEAPAPGGRQSGVCGGDTHRGDDGACEMPVENPDAPVTPAPAAAAVETPQATEPESAAGAEVKPQSEQDESAGNAGQAGLPATAVAAVTEGSVTIYPDGEAPESLSSEGTAAGRMPVATASPGGGVRMLVPPEGNGDYLTVGQVERLLHAAYLRGRNEAVAAKIEADTSIRTLPQRDDVLFSTRPSVWELAR